VGFIDEVDREKGEGMNKVICLGEEIEGIAKEIFGVAGNFKKAVYKYETGSYEGSGQLIVKTIDNKFWVQELGHCSCYGPLDRWQPSVKYNSIEEIPGSAEWKKIWKGVTEKTNLEDNQ
jgi:hypothetical protein